MEIKRQIKPIGYGSLALPTALFASIFMFYSIKEGTIGELILARIGLDPELYGIIGLVLFISAYVLGSKFKHHIFARNGFQFVKIMLYIHLLVFALYIFVKFVRLFLMILGTLPQ